MKTSLTKFRNRVAAKKQGGATVIEYALIAALIAIALVVAMGALGDGIGTKFTEVGNTIDTAGD